MNFENPIGQIIKYNDIDWHVVGVAKDFIMNSPFQKIEPIVIQGAKSWFSVIHVRFNEKLTTSQSLEKAESIFQKYNPEYPFDYEFVDQRYAEKFDDGQRTQKLVGLFTLLVIFISCLGLFGLASYMAENRIKEIGIRKVLGATIASIAKLLSIDFLKLILVSIVISVPVSWYFMSNWLATYEYRVSISWWTFALAGMLALLIAAFTISYQSVKAAITNPVKSLRIE